MPNERQKTVTGYKAGCGHWSSVAVQAFSEPEICHGARVNLQAAARFAHRSGAKVGVRMQEPLEICLDAGAKQKP